MGSYWKNFRDPRNGIRSSLGHNLCLAAGLKNNTTTVRGNTTDNVRVFHLGDSQSQTDYILSSQVELCPGVEAYGVLGEPEIFIRHGNQLASSDKGKPSNYTHAADAHHWNASFISYVGAHLNYYDTKYSTHITELQNDMACLNCMADNAKVIQLVTTSKLKKLLATQSMGLPECYALRAGTETGIITRCSKVNATFVGVRTRCEFQPVFGNYTIDADGKTLRNKTKCFWQDSIA